MPEVATDVEQRVAGGGGRRVGEAVAEIESGLVPPTSKPREGIDSAVPFVLAKRYDGYPELPDELLDLAAWRAAAPSREHKARLDQRRPDPNVFCFENSTDELEIYPGSEKRR